MDDEYCQYHAFSGSVQRRCQSDHKQYSVRIRAVAGRGWCGVARQPAELHPHSLVAQVWTPQMNSQRDLDLMALGPPCQARLGCSSPKSAMSLRVPPSAATNRLNTSWFETSPLPIWETRATDTRGSRLPITVPLRNRAATRSGLIRRILTNSDGCAQAEWLVFASPRGVSADSA
jgi:hypothetical protein